VQYSTFKNFLNYLNKFSIYFFFAKHFAENNLFSFSLSFPEQNQNQRKCSFDVFGTKTKTIVWERFLMNV
jgi:hypothetical protein